MTEAVIVSTARTPVGKAYRGALNDTPGATLGGHAIAEALKRSGGWTYVRSGQMEGWASARYLRPALSFSGGPPPFPLHCVGTEPFWALTSRSRPCSASSTAD